MKTWKERSSMFLEFTERDEGAAAPRPFWRSAVAVFGGFAMAGCGGLADDGVPLDDAALNAPDDGYDDADTATTASKDTTGTKKTTFTKDTKDTTGTNKTTFTTKSSRRTRPARTRRPSRRTRARTRPARTRRPCKGDDSKDTDRARTRPRSRRTARTRPGPTRRPSRRRPSRRTRPARTRRRLRRGGRREQDTDGYTHARGRTRRARTRDTRTRTDHEDDQHEGQRATPTREARDEGTRRHEGRREREGRQRATGRDEPCAGPRAAPPPRRARGGAAAAGAGRTGGPPARRARRAGDSRKAPRSPRDVTRCSDWAAGAATRCTWSGTSGCTRSGSPSCFARTRSPTRARCAIRTRGRRARAARAPWARARLRRARWTGRDRTSSSSTSTDRRCSGSSGRNGALPPEQLLPLALHLASALHFIAAEGFVHLDVKPGNVVVGVPPRLLDLSIARTIESAATLRHAIGTDPTWRPSSAIRRCAPGGVGTSCRRVGARRDALPRGDRRRSVPAASGGAAARTVLLRFPQLVRAPASAGRGRARALGPPPRHARAPIPRSARPRGTSRTLSSRSSWTCRSDSGSRRGFASSRCAEARALGAVASPVATRGTRAVVANHLEVTGASPSEVSGGHHPGSRRRDDLRRRRRRGRRSRRRHHDPGKKYGPRRTPGPGIRGCRPRVPPRRPGVRRGRAGPYAGAGRTYPWTGRPYRGAARGARNRGRGGRTGSRRRPEVSRYRSPVPGVPGRVMPVTRVSPVAGAYQPKSKHDAHSEVRPRPQSPDPRSGDPSPAVCRIVNVRGRGAIAVGRHVSVLVGVGHPDPAVLVRVHPIPGRQRRCLRLSLRRLRGGGGVSAGGDGGASDGGASDCGGLGEDCSSWAGVVRADSTSAAHDSTMTRAAS